MAADAPTSAAASAVAARPSILRRLVALDTDLSLRIHSFCRPVPRPLLKALEISGDGRFWFPIPVALLPLSSASDAAYSLFLGLLLGSLLDLLLVGLIKHLVRRPRPVYNKGMSLTFAVDHWSFPSGHSSRVFFIAAFLRLSSASLVRVLLFDGRVAPARRWIEDYYDGELAELLVWIVSIWSVATSASRVLLDCLSKDAVKVNEKDWRRSHLPIIQEMSSGDEDHTSHEGRECISCGMGNAFLARHNPHRTPVASVVHHHHHHEAAHRMKSRRATGFEQHLMPPPPPPSPRH